MYYICISICFIFSCLNVKKMFRRFILPGIHFLNHTFVFVLFCFFYYSTKILTCFKFTSETHSYIKHGGLKVVLGMNIYIINTEVKTLLIMHKSF